MSRRSRTMRTMPWLVLVAGLTWGIASPAGARVADAPLPEKVWRTAANDICRQSVILRGEIADEVFGGLEPDGTPSVELMTSYVTQIEPVVQQQIDSIDALREPRKLRKKVGALLDTAQDELDALVADPAIGVETNPFGATELAAGKLKLKQCA